MRRFERPQFLATRAATPTDYLSAGIVLALVMLLAAVFAPIAPAVRASSSTDLLSASYTAAIVAQGITAFLLFGQWRAGRHASIGILAVAFAFSATMIAAYWIEYPGTIGENGLVGIVIGSARYLWLVWHLGFCAIVACFLIPPNRLRRSERVVRSIGIAAAALACAAFLAVVLDSGVLPAIVIDGSVAPFYQNVLSPSVIVAGIVTLVAVVAVTRLRRWIDVYLAVFLVGLIVEAYLHQIGGKRFSYGWYASRTAIVIVSLAIVFELIRQVNALYSGLAHQNRRLAFAATIDPLTRVANRRAFDAQLSGLRQPAVLMIIDIDHFKVLNDRLGHRAGDEYLRRIARTLAANVLRTEDLLARYGGDEFAAILHGTEIDDGLIVAERIRRAVRDLAIVYDEGAILTVSIGLASYQHDESPLDLVHRADEALYRAKSEGRDRIAFDEQITVRSIVGRTM